MPHPLSSDQLALIVVVSILTGFIAGLLLARWVVIRLLVRADRLKNDARDHMLRAGELHNETMFLCAQIEAARRGEGLSGAAADKEVPPGTAGAPTDGRF